MQAPKLVVVLGGGGASTAFGFPCALLIVRVANSNSKTQQPSSLAGMGMGGDCKGGAPWGGGLGQELGGLAQGGLWGGVFACT